jgi:hypothetical protein
LFLYRYKGKNIKSIPHLTKTAAFQIVGEYENLRKRRLNDDQYKRSLNLALNMITNELNNLLTKFWSSKLSFSIRNDYIHILRTSNKKSKTSRKTMAN